MWEIQLEIAKELAIKAGKKIMEYYHSSFDVEIKEDDSPVTSADIAANKIIVDGLKEKFPTYAILSEEIADDFDRLHNDYVWIIDPLDGTQDFVNQGDGFGVNIALAYKHQLVVGVVYIPVNDELYFASKGNGSFCEHGGIVTRNHVSNKTTDLTCLISKYHFSSIEKTLIEKYSDRIARYLPYGASIKACLIAKGEAELSYRLYSGTKEWDTAAPELILLEAGGIVVKPDGSLMTYNRLDVRNTEGFILANRKENILL